MEVMIESERLRDVHLIDHDFAGAVRKAPTFVVILLKDGPRLSDIFFGQGK